MANTYTQIYFGVAGVLLSGSSQASTIAWPDCRRSPKPRTGCRARCCWSPGSKLSGRLTVPAEQLLLNEQLYRLLFTAGNALTLGEATARAKASVLSDRW